MKYFIRLLASTRKKFNLLFSIVAHIATVGFAGGALFLLGFYVIPVFADKIPHVNATFKQSETPTANYFPNSVIEALVVKGDTR